MARVAHLTTVHSASDTRIFYRECRSLQRRGHDVYVIAPGPGTSVHPDVHMLGVPRPLDRRQRVLVTARQVFLQALKLSADIYHIHDPEFLPWAILLRRRLRARVVYDSHEYYQQAILGRPWLPAPLRTSLSHVVARLEPAMASWLDAVVTADEGQQATFRRRYRAKRVITVRNLPPREVFDGADVPSAELPRRLFHIGSISEDRGWSQIVATADTLRAHGVEVIVVGKAPQSGVPENLRLTGYVTLPEVGRLTKGGGIGLSALRVTPQNLLGVPMKVFEYMAMGLPVLASDIEPHRDVIQEYGVGRLYPPLDDQACAAEVLWLLSHAEAALEMSRRGRRAYLEGLNFDQEGAKLADLYEELLGAQTA